MTLHLRVANTDDVDTLLQWRRETAAWLATLGSDQWSLPYPRDILEHRTAAGATLMASTTPDGPAVATITLVAQGDPGLWTPQDRATPAWYVHKLSSPVRGTGAGALMLAWARAQALDFGAELMRLDVWTTNSALRSYYEGQGYELQRVVTAEGVRSGALYSRPTAGAIAPTDVVGPTDWAAPNMY